MSSSIPAGPLVGVRVLDFSSFIAGSFTAMMLGDLGADVVKVEPLHGDLCRHWGPFIEGESRFFQGWNRNKRSVAVDLAAARGREIAHRLAAEADVLVENFRPGVTERLQIDYARLRELNPRLIYASSTAFGARGPYRDRPGYDPVLQAMGGSAHLQARYSGVVSINSTAVSDYHAATLLLAAIHAALYHRERTGEGQRVETSLLQAIMSTQSHFYVQPLARQEAGPLGIYPYRLFDTQDRPIFIAGGTDKFWRLLCDALGVPELGTHPEYDSNPKRVHQAEALTARLQPIFATRGAEHWEALLVECGVPCGAVRTPTEFFDDPQVEAMEMRPVVEHSVSGPLRVAGVPVHFEKTPGAVQRAAPVLGEHSSEVLRQLGYSDDAIEDLVHDRVVVAWSPAVDR
jgi:crotonobetainyl-CoA:carnitine CoA-transferase CaiB-like acyl-CoA transferase